MDNPIAYPYHRYTTKNWITHSGPQKRCVVSQYYPYRCTKRCVEGLATSVPAHGERRQEGREEFKGESKVVKALAMGVEMHEWTGVVYLFSVDRKSVHRQNHFFKRNSTKGDQKNNEKWTTQITYKKETEQKMTKLEQKMKVELA